MLNTNQSLRNFFLQLQRAALVAFLIFTSSSGQADDIEIYMGTGTSDAAETHPNVLFILDTSGSMRARDAGANRRTPRMTVLKQAMDDLLSTLDNVNIGLARFSSSGGSIIFPISPINGNANLIVGESTSTQALSFKATLINDTDDAEERISGSSTGQVFLNDEVLEAFDFGGTTGQSGTETYLVADTLDDISEYAPSRYGGRMLDRSYAYIHYIVDLGVRFQSVNIPQGTTIQSAFIDFTHRIRRTNRTNAVISGLDISNTTAFSTARRDLSSRDTTTATVAWDGIPGGQKNTKFSTPDVGTIVQEIVNRNDWSSGNSMGFKIATSSGNRYPYSRNSSTTRQPMLRIQTQAVAGVEGDDQLLAFRFEDIRIPRGAALTSAKILVTNSAAGGSNAVTWRIQAEQVDDSPHLTTTTNNLSSRKGGGNVVNWTIDSSTLNVAPQLNTCSVTTGTTGAASQCEDQFTEESADISSVVTQVTNRPGWCGGNAITFLIDANSPNANEMRKLFSRDHSDGAPLAPKFAYSYMPQAGCMSSREVSQVSSSGDDAEQYPDGYDSRVDTVGDDLVLGVDAQNGSQSVGLRFTTVEVPKDVTIKEAFIEFRSKGTSTGAASYTIKANNVGNMGPIGNSANAISDLPTTSASATWSISEDGEDDWDTDGSEQVTPDLTALVQEVVNRNDWSSKNNMGFVVTGTGTRRAESYDSDPSRAPRLVITYDDSVSVPFKSIREVLKQSVRDLPASGGTPIAGALLETAKYFSGKEMVHGKNRGYYGKISHPGTYCAGPGNCPGTNSYNTDQFGVRNPSGCNPNNQNSYRCRGRRIDGNPDYISPIKTDLECAANHQVLLTDGQAGGNDQNRIKTHIGKSNCYQNNSSFKLPEHANHSYAAGGGYYSYRANAEHCIPDLIQYMATEDQNTSIAGKQNVITHTVAFALKSAGPVQFLKDLANVGEGKHYSADTAGDLQDVFKVILSDVRSAPSSFAAPALAIDAFNKLTSRDDVYYGMFTPELTQRWNGNIKKYKLCLQDSCGKLGDVLDDGGNSVVDRSDPKKPKFKTDSQSIWSTIKDGQAVTKGGAGAEITDYTETLLLTDSITSNPASTNERGKILSTEAGYFITSANWTDANKDAVRRKVCKGTASRFTNLNTADGKDCEKRMLWMLGKKHTTDAEHDVSSTERWSVSDVLHSSPVVITYGGTAPTSTSTATFIDKIIYGTNAGYLHMVNGKTGKEEWRYMPNDFWVEQRQLFDNRQDKHKYGMDSTPTIWACDKNNNGSIEPLDGAQARGIDSGHGDGACSDNNGDFVRVITSTRRGGANGGETGLIYALDLSASITNDTAIVNPMFMWRIQGGQGDFSRLGQTWSQPRITTIMVNKNGRIYPKDVLIFGGGYDTALDDSSVYTTSENGNRDFKGNAIYIVDPMDGTKILSISGLGSGADIQIDDMHYSIPSRIEFLDSDIDGLTDRLYVGDLGGQVWRVDLSEAVPMTGGTPAGGPPGSKGTVVGLLAQISGNAAEDRRRFFEPPSIVQVSDALYADEPEYDYVLMGTGNRPKPLEQTVSDRFYAFRDREIDSNALGDNDSDHFAEENDGYPGNSSSPYSHADNTSLINVTEKGLADQAKLDENLIKDSNGWYIDFAEANASISGRSNSKGEKTLSAPITAGGAVAFTTFDPETEQSPAGGGAGTGAGTGGVTSQQAQSSDPCSAAPNIGTARAYHLTILAADAPEISELGGGAGSDRFRGTIGSGIPSDVIPVFTEHGVVGIVQSDGVPTTLGSLSETTPERAYWSESLDF